jgi:uroporphyrinogen decarboxylase
LIDAGVDAINPIQVNAENMNAKKLADEFKGDCVFFGGIDENELLIHGTEEEVRKGTREIIDTLGKYGRYIVAASHDWLLPEVPAKNIVAMYDEAKKYRTGR